jgi:hypothetical protein
MGTVLSAARDRRGRLWFSTTRGVSYFQPQIRDAPPPPQIRIGGLRIGGVEQPLSAAGEERIADLELLPGRSQLEVDFGIQFHRRRVVDVVRLRRGRGLERAASRDVVNQREPRAWN